MIEGVVGKAKKAKTFFIHEPLLTTSSAYSQRALKTSFEEGNEGRVELEDESPLTFGLLSEYLCMGQILDLEKKTWKNKFLKLSALWLLSYYLQMPKPLNYPMWRLLLWMDEDVKKGGIGISAPDVEDICDKTSMDSMLRKFLVDLLRSEGDLKLSNDAPNLMLKDMVQELKRKSDGR